MFSKPASAADARPNKNNMTSFKNKISQRKRKTGGTTEIDGSSEQKQSEKNPKQTQRAGKQRNRNKNGKKDSLLDVQPNPNNNKVTNNTPDVAASVNVVIQDADFPDVVLRSDKRTNSADSVKRYSDSFVIENGGENDDDKLSRHSAIERPGLTRAVSGFLVVDSTKKHRRFSDLFRPKLSCSTENLKMSSTPKSDNKPTVSDGVNNTTNVKNKRNTAKSSESSPAKFASPKATGKKDTTTTYSSTAPSTQTSYLKRVRSRIYKSKSDDTSKIDLDKSKKLKTKKSIECNGRIPEDEVAVLTPAGVRKSLTNFDFRLVRQSSNLERSMTRGFFGSRKSIDEVDGDVATAKPVLEKSKSSSAINLNLLRTRRNKLMEQAAAWRQAASSCKDEFDFIAFGAASKLSGSTTSLHKFPSWLHLNKPQQNQQQHEEEASESKPGHPVSRSGSDRRPDAVREEAHHHRHQDSDTSNMEGVQSAGDNDKSEGATPDSSISLPVTGNKRKVNSNINRSESVKEQSEKRKQRRNISDPSHNTSCDVDLDRQQTNFAKNTDSGSSSNSNVSCNGRLSESPSNSVDVHHASLRTNSESDSDMDGEAYPLTWQQLLPEEEVKNLSDYEKKRQDVINELFHTEGSHVRNLKVLYKIFYRRLQQSQILKPDDLNLIFPNIKEMLDIHTEINKEMRRIRKEDPLVKESLGDALVKLFCGTQGEALQQAAATFCERQQLALEFIKKRRERDSKFDTLLSECEKKRQCRRLPLQGIVPTEMQRLSKYPLLLDRLISSTEKDCTQTEELAKLKRVHQMSKEILNYVNESAKIAHNKHRLEEIQSHLDPSMFERADHSIVNEFRNFDLKRYRLLLEGSMQLRRPNKALVPVHVLLMEEMAVILHKDGDSFLMKFFQSGSSAQPTPLSPIIKMSTLLVRRNAVCKNALFILSTSANTSQMYDLIAEDETKREWWYKHFTDAYESYNKREGKPSKRPPAGVSVGAAAAETESESEPEVPPTPGAADLSDRAEAATATVVDESGSDGERVATKKDDADEAEGRDDVGGGGDLDGSLERAESEEPEMIGGGDEKIKVTAEEWPLIQPSQVNVAIPPVHTAETTLTPLEQIRRKDALVKQTLAEKEGLVADMLSIPREDFHHIADMATADVASGGGHLTERLLASIFQVNQLQKAVNASLDVTESEVIMAKGGKHPACASQEAAAPQQDRSVIPIVPVSLVSEIAASLSSQLTTLLSEVKEVVKERDMLRREFDKVKERLHEEHNLHSPVQYEECNSDESGPEIFSEAATGEHQ